MNQIKEQILKIDKFISLHKLSLPFIGVSLGLVSVLFALLFKFEIGVFGIGLLVIEFSFALFYTFIKYPKLWLYIVILSAVLFVQEGDEGVSEIDVIVALFYLGSLFSWLFWQIFVKKEKIIHNIGDWLFVLFLLLCLGNLIVALSNGVTLLNWSREYVLLLFYLYYIPIRKYFIKKEDFIGLIIAFAVMVFFVDISNFYKYYSNGFNNLQYAYQLMWSASYNQVLFTSAASAGVLFLLNNKKIQWRIVLLFFTILTIAALIVTFSRTFWLILLLNVVIIFLLVNYQKKLRLILYTSVTVAVIVFAVFSLFQNNAKIFIKIIERRFTSSSKGTADPSVLIRFHEYQAAYKLIQKYPLGGNGLSKKFHFYNFLTGFENRTNVQHNMYLFLAYRLGIPLAIMFLLPFLYFYFQSMKYSLLAEDETSRNFAIIAFMTLNVFFISGFSCTQVIIRDSIFTFFMSFASINIAMANTKLKDFSWKKLFLLNTSKVDL